MALAILVAEGRDNRKADLRRARRWTWGAIAVATISLLSPVAALNYIVDNHNLLKDQSESSELLDYVSNLRKAPFGVPYTFNDRSVKLLVASQSQAKCLVIGASHVMSLRRTNNPLLGEECPSLDNAGVTGASFEDVITFLGIGLKNPNIDKVIVGISLWTLKRNTRLNWMRNTREMLDARQAFGLSTIPYDDMVLAGSESWIEQLFSLKYLRINYKFIKRAWAGKTSLTYDSRSLAEAELKDVMALRSDASISYPQEWRPTPKNEDLDTTDQWIAPPFVDSEVLQELTTALEVLRKAGKKVVLFEGPYHPYVVDKCPKENICQAIPVVTAAVRSMAAKLNAPIIGGYLPQAFELSSDDFIDFQHTRGDSSAKIGLQQISQ
ncbi:hypothetical protein [Dongia rigui]|uniref:Uncharacterized protein n=1 Tax=Dongia rigui TaxID=940149 RepID=A0ABU5E253_9PROT|nr:hypothetical protein [Dongia rigui]MDY0873645.1 hypothetical protein [Dongia rigui]